MANRTVGVNIAFNADTSKAKAQIQELQTLLNKITYSGATGAGQNKISDDLKNASAAAKELQYHLNNAYNANTGKLDLSLLDKSLKTTGSNITNLSTNLLSAGATGQQAFVKMAQSISQAEQPMLKISSKVKDFAKVLENAAKYQIGNVVVQGFMSSITSAIGYVKDLNSSLNEIRIVSGKSADEMVRFAEEANKAAKRLSTTTTDYTNASLIYYQQGLSEADVAARTETTIKMANVAGTSAQTVSDQMTAVWNNFYDGSKSLEYYSDVMVKLGAATASSTDEISEGVNKFAATAKTVGLSYEYATAALATVTATTRESASTVGNAFRTLFSRIQGLNLGETLDDGTTLNKYSQALEKVGIDIKDQNGELKDMDQILDEMGSKWNTISKDQQVALAQTVGGARQYAQLMALMNEWDYFKENLDVAYNSEGALEEQAKVYEESWAAASKRVEASLQGVYQSLLDDKLFISINNGFANALGGLEAFIEGLGGVKPLIIGIGSIIASAFAEKVPDALRTAKYNIDLVSKGSEEAYKGIQKQMQDATDKAFTKFAETKGAEGINPESSTALELRYSNDLLMAKNKLAAITDKMTAAEKQQYNVELSLIEAHQKETAELQQKCEELENAIELQREELVLGTEKTYGVNDSKFTNEWADAFGAKENKYSSLSDKYLKDKSLSGLSDEATNKYLAYVEVGEQQLPALWNEIDSFTQKINKSYEELNRILANGIANGEKIKVENLFSEDILTHIDTIKNKLLEINNSNIDNDSKLYAMKKSIEGIAAAIPPAIQQATGLSKIFEKIGKAKNIENLENDFDELYQIMEQAKVEGEKAGEKVLEAFHDTKNIRGYIRNVKNGSKATEELGKKKNLVKQLMDEFKPNHIISTSEALASATASLGNLVSIANSFTSLFTFDEDLNGWEQFISKLSSVAFLIPQLITCYQNFGKIVSWFSDQQKKHAEAQAAEATAQAIALAATKAKTAEDTKAVVIEKLKTVQLANTRNKLLEQLAAILGVSSAEEAEQILIKKGIIVKNESFKQIRANVLARADEVAAIAGEIAAEKVKTVATKTETEVVKKNTEEKQRNAAAGGIWSIALMAVAAVIGGIVAAVKKANEEAEEAAKKAEELTNKTNEQVKSNGELIDSYNDLMSQYHSIMEEYEAGQSTQEDVINIQDQLKDKALEVAEALGVESIALKALQGDFEGIQKAIDNERQKEIEEALDDNVTDNENKGNAFVKAMGLTYYRGNENYGSYLAYGQSALKGIYNTDDFENYKYLKGYDSAVQIISENNNADDYLKAYEEVLDYKEKLEKNYDKDTLNNSKLYKEIVQWLNKSSDEYEAYKASEEQIRSLKIESNALDFKTDEGIGLRDISSVTEFDAYREQLINELSGVQGIEEDARNETNQAWMDIVAGVDAYLGTLSSLSDYIIKSNAFDDLAEKFKGESLKDAKQKVIDAYNNLSEEDKELFFQIDFNVYDIEDNLDQALAYLRAKAAQEKIEAELEIVTSGIDLLKNGKATTDDIVAWAQQMNAAFGENWDGKGFGLEQFLGLSSTEQQKWLQGTKTGLGEVYSNNREERYNAAEQAQIDIQNQLDEMDKKEYIASSSDYSLSQIEKAQVNAVNFSTVQAAYNEAVANGTGASFDWETMTRAQGIYGITSKEDFDQQKADNQGIIDQYNELTNKVKEYEQAKKDIDIEKQVEDAYGWRDALQEQAEALDINYDEVQDYADALAKQLKNEKLTRKELEKLALTNKRLEKGIKSVNENWDDFSTMMKGVNNDFSKLDKTSPDVINNFDNMRTALADILDWDASSVTDEMIEMAYSSGQLKGIMEGDVQALKDFQLAAANKVIIDADINSEELVGKFSTLSDTLQSMADLDPVTLEGQLNDEQFISACQDMINAAGMTVEQAQAYFDALGYEAEITKKPVTTNTITDMQVPIFSLNSDGSVSIKYEKGTATSNTITEILEIKSINKKSVGSGLSSNRSNANKGSGGGGSAPKHAEKKNDSDKERYHTLTNQLEDIKAEYDDISEASDRAFGKDKLKNLDAQIEKTDELIDKQEEYLDAIEANLPVDKAVMDAYYQDTIGGPAIEYDERGNIANYDAIQDAMFAKYNSMADAYDEDSTEWQVFEKKYEQLEKYIEQYEETYDLLRDQEQEYQDLLNQRIDLQLEKVQYTVELKLNVSEDQVKLIEYQLDKVEDDGFKSLEAIGLLTAKANELNNQMQINKQGLNEALGLTLSLQEIQQIMAGSMDVLNGRNFTEDQIDAVKEYRDNLLDLNGEFDDIRENIEDKMMETFDAWNEKLETGIDLLDHYGSILESYQNIVDIVGQDTMGLSEEFISNLSQGQVDNAIDKVEATKKAYESLEQARAAAEDKLNEARANGDAASQEMWEKTLEELTEHSQEAQENMLSAWEDALSSIADQFELTVERVVKNFNDAVYSLGGLEGLADDFSKQQERADIMLDDYQKIYELSKLSRDINKSIDDTDLIGGKQKLKKLLGEVNALQEDGVEMSQYDLEYLQKTYDLRLAELELEEAQRAKNTVRLSKDNESNWSYVYTQNTDAVDAAQQKYEDALYAMQDLSSNYIDEMSEKLIETSQEMAEALAELRVEDFASIDDYYAEVDRVQKYYQEQMEFQENELDKAIANNKTLYDEDWTAYHNATGYKISDTEDFVTAFKDSMLGTLMNSNSDVANFNDLIAGSVDGLTQGLLQAADTYYRNLEEAMNAAGTSTETFGQDIGEQIGQVVAKSEEGAAAVEDMADRMNAAINGTMDAIVSWQQSYGLAMEQIIQSNLDVIESFNEMLATLSGVGEGVTVSYDIAKNGSTTAEPERFASGGYTGNWGNSGKLGILDEKELILNQNDTANMLNMLQLTHDLLDMIDLQTQSAKLGFGNLVASTIKDSQKEVLEQKVEITAEFPNVSDHNEIEEALMNLTNTASQYANRK